ncbi:hypothetical protein J2S53_000576 [Actinopolyspora lacussalsi]|nr:hypothetical protein [Actinopolyspora lacussalsi]
MSDNEILAAEHAPAEPLGDEAEFAALVESFVREQAPRVFALVEEVGERADAEIFAWGLALAEHAEVFGAAGRMRGSFGSAESACEVLGMARELRLVWLPET